MLLTNVKLEDYTVIKLASNLLTAETAVDFKKEMKELVEQGVDQIVMDLSNIEFMDSTGLAALVTSVKMVGKKGEFLLSGVKSSILPLFKITKMDSVFSIYDDVSSAINANK